MSSLQQFTNAAYVWGSVAFAAAWQSAIVAIVAVALLSRITRVSAATRSAVWWVLLLASIAIPAYTAWPIANATPEMLGPVMQTVLVIHDEAVTAPSTKSSESLSAITPIIRERPPIARTLAISPTIVRALATLWTFIATTLLIRLALGVVTILAIKRRSSPAPAHITALFTKLGAQSVAVRVTDDLPVPGVVGYLRPVVLLPRRTVHQLDETAMSHVLLHELAHIRRRDSWAALLLRIVRALAFPLPAIHIIARQLEIDQELACDEWALNRCGAKATDYVNSLLRIGEVTVGSRMKRRALVPAAVTQLRLRVESLLRGHRPRTSKHSWARGVFMGGAFASALIPLSGVAPAFALVAFKSERATAVTSPQLSPMSVQTVPASAPATSEARKPATIDRGSIEEVSNKASVPTTSDTVNALIAELHAPDAETRARVAYSLSHYRKAALGATEALIAMLGDDERVARESDVVSKVWFDKEDRNVTSPGEEAAKALLYVGRDALAQVNSALSTLNGSAKVRAVWVAALLKNYD